MRKLPLRKWLWKTVRLVVAAIIISCLIDLLYFTTRDFTEAFRRVAESDRSSGLEKYSSPVVFSSYEQNFNQVSIWEGLLREREERPEDEVIKITKKSLILNVSGNQIDCHYEVFLPKDTPLFRSIMRGAGNRTPELVTDILGGVTVDNRPLRFDPAVFDVGENEANGRFLLNARNVVFDRETLVIISRPSLHYKFDIELNEVIINTAESRVGSVNLLPIAQSQDQARYVIAKEDSGDRLYISINTDYGIPRESLANIMRKIGSANIPVVGSLIYGFLQSIPFLLYLWFERRRKNPLPSFVARYSGVISLLLAFHYGYYVLSALNLSQYVWGNLARVTSVLLRGVKIWPFWPANDYGVGTGLLMLMLAGLVWPTMVINWEKNRNMAPVSKRTMIAFVIVLTVLVLGGGASLLWLVNEQKFASGITLGTVAAIYLYLILLLLYISCSWLLYEIFGGNRAFIFSISMVLIIVLLTLVGTLPAISPASLKYTVTRDAIQILVIVTIGTTMIMGLTRLLYHVITGKFLSRDSQKNLRRWLIAGAVLLSFPAIWLKDDNYISWHFIWSLGSALKNFFLFVLLWIIIKILLRLSREQEWPIFNKTILDAGLILSVSFFFSSTSLWFYIPIPFIVGYILVDRFLIKEPESKDYAVEVKTERGVIIKKIISLNEARKSFKTFKKELLGKLGKGDIEYSKYEAGINNFEQVVDKKEKRLNKNGIKGKEIVFAFGPTDSPWQNGKIFAGYSIFFALPWMVLAVRNLLNESFGAVDYLFLDLLSSILTVIIKWPLYGFFFGYFYTYIRGKNGMQKGFWFFLTLILPSLVATATFEYPNSEAWIVFSVWGLQVFIHVMLLGLIAGDLETLRRTGFSWNHLVEIYNLSSLSAWASTVLVAIGAAVTTLITSGVSVLITEGLKYIGVLPPEIKPPGR